MDKVNVIKKIVAMLVLGIFLLIGYSGSVCNMGQSAMGNQRDCGSQLPTPDGCFIPATTNLCSQYHLNFFHHYFNFTVSNLFLIAFVLTVIIWLNNLITSKRQLCAYCLSYLRQRLRLLPSRLDYYLNWQTILNLQNCAIASR